MYYQNRAEAGRKLAEKLEEYKSKHIVVLALGLSSSIVAAQVAMSLHSNLLVYLFKYINLPGEPEALAGLGSGDIFTFNTQYSSGQLDDFMSEYHTFIEQSRREQSHELNMILGDSGQIDKSLLRHRTVILVADGFANGFVLNIAADYLKTIAIEKLVVATPIASVNAVDRMHLVADEIRCLSTADNFMGVNHYYDDNYVPTPEDVAKIMRNISMNWERHKEGGRQH